MKNTQQSEHLIEEDQMRKKKMKGIEFFFSVPFQAVFNI